MAQDRFDIEKVHENFKAALKEEADVLIDFYIEGYKELYKCVAIACNQNYHFFV